MTMTPTPIPIAANEQVARLISLDLIDADPDQPRKSFPEGPLQELADRIWYQGLIQPITATPTEDGRLKIFTGERRYRSFKINRERADRFFAANTEEVPADHPALRYERWTSIPVLEAPPVDPSDRLLLQVGENHDRSDLSLYERVTAIYKSYQLSGLKGKEFSEKAGISQGTLSTYKGLAASSGLTKLALETCVLQDQIAAKLFQQLPYDIQENLLSRAQEEEAFLTRVQLKRELDAIEAAKELAKQAAAGEGGEDGGKGSQGGAAGANDNGSNASAEGNGKKPGASSAPNAAPPSPEPDGPVLTVDALLWLQQVLERFDAGEEDEPLRLLSFETLSQAVLRSSPFILIREEADLPVPTPPPPGDAPEEVPAHA